MKDLVIECINVFNVIHNKIYSIYTLKRRWKHARAVHYKTMTVCERWSGIESFLVESMLLSLPVGYAVTILAMIIAFVV
jgi:hypothetical protein